MAQSVKHLPCRYEELSWDSQNPCPKPCVVDPWNSLAGHPAWWGCRSVRPCLRRRVEGSQRPTPEVILCLSHVQHALWALPIQTWMYTRTHPHQESGGSEASISVLNRGRLSLTEIRIICMRCRNGASVSMLIWTHRQCPSHCSPVTVFCVITKDEQKGGLQGARWSLCRKRRLTLLVATQWEQGLCFGQAGWVWLVCKASVTAVQVAVFQRLWNWPALCGSHAAQDSKQAHGHVLTTSSNSEPTIFKFHSELSKSPPETWLAVWYYLISFPWRVSASLPCFRQLVETHSGEDSASVGSAVWPYLLSSLGSAETPWHLTVANNST